MTLLSRRAVIGAVPLAVLVAGCSTGAGGGSRPSSPATGPGPGHYKMDLGGYTGPELTTESITLRVMRQSWNDGTNAVFDKQVKAFQSAYPNITVKQELVPYGDLDQKLRTDFAAGNAADIIMGETALVSSYTYGDIAVAIGDYYTDEYRKSFFADLQDAVTVDGHMWALPSFHNAQGIKYNKDLFSRAGVDMPPETADLSKAWTLDQWFETWAALRTWIDKSNNTSIYPIAPSGYGNGGPGSNYQQLEQFWLRSMGSPDAGHDTDEYKVFAGISEDGTTVDGYLNNPLAVKGATNYQTIFNNKWSPTGTQSTMYESGQAVCAWGGEVSVGVKFEQGLVPLPKSQVIAASDASDAFIVTSQTQHPAEAAALLAALNTTEVMTDWTEQWLGVPALETVVAKLPKSVNDLHFQVSTAMCKISVPMPKTPAWFEYDNQMNQTMKNIALGADPAGALNQAATSIDQQLAKYKK